MADRDADTSSRALTARSIVIGAVVLLAVAGAFLVGYSIVGGDSGSDQAGSTAGGSRPAGEARPGEGFAVLSVHRCATQLAVGQSFVQVSHRLSMPLPASSSDRLAVYASSVGSLLVGPKGWECRATVGADGTQTIGLAPPGFERPAWSAGKGDAAVTATLIPACAGCIASTICAFFPQEEVVQSYGDELECTPVPAGEQVSHVARSTALFTDPPGVKGNGVGSGGSLPSLGAVAFGTESGAVQVSCTLPPALAEVCPGLVGATLALRG
jgi:hypothetical protein